MEIDNKRHSEEFWIEVVENCIDEGESIVCVPLAAFPRSTAVRLAIKLNVTVFIKENDYHFSARKEITEALLKEADTLH